MTNLCRSNFDAYEKGKDIGTRRRHCSHGFAFASPLLETVSFIRRILDDKLASEFLFDPYITQTCILAGVACSYAAKGKMPPYKAGRLLPLEFYEDLPVAPELEEHFYGSPSPKS
jgi:hypothetical protein